MNITPYTPGQTLIAAAPLDVAVAPGETLREVLDELHMTQLELASRTGVSTKHINQVVKGLVPLSADIAQRLENVTGVPARLWSRLESDYRTALAKEARASVYATNIDWLKEVPIRALVKAGVLPATPSDKPSRVDQLLHFFGVASIDAFRATTPVAAFRKSQAFEQNDYAVAAWLRIGELAARAMEMPDYAPHSLQERIPEFRKLTTLAPGTALPRLVELASSVGLAVVFVPEVEGARAYGATFWISPRRPVIQLSTRGGTLDKFWETFFHELGHVLLHDRKSVFIEEEEEDDDTEIAELEAILFARETLLPGVTRADLTQLSSEADVSSFADKHGILAGIVVAELQRARLWEFTQGRQLRRAVSPADLPGFDRPRIPSVRPSRLQWKLPGLDHE